MQICVFCSAGNELRVEFETDVLEFVEGLRARNGSLIYGGGADGMMGLFADQALKLGCAVTGIIPKFFVNGELNSAREIAHRELTELIVVDDLMQRKKLMLERSDAFLIFPGGFGTLDEALEVITWACLEQIHKPIIFVNLRDFWTSQLKVFSELEQRGAISAKAMRKMESCTEVSEIWTKLGI